MFDVGFSELMVIAVVALVVIGPERLPSVARTLGHLFGRLQRYVNDVKADISREMELEELKKFKDQFQEAAQSVESSVRAEVESAESAVNRMAEEANPQSLLAQEGVLADTGTIDAQAKLSVAEPSTLPESAEMSAVASQQDAPTATQEGKAPV